MLVGSKALAVGIATDFLAAHPYTKKAKNAVHTLIAVTPPTAQQPRWVIVLKAATTQKVVTIIVYAETGQATYGAGV